MMREVYEMLDLRKTHTNPFDPEGNGLVEQTNGAIHNLLLAFTKYGHEHNWDAHLPLCLLAYYRAIHSSTGFTPHYLWTGHDLCLPGDLCYPLPSPGPTTPQTCAKKICKGIRSAHNAVRIILGTASLHQTQQFDRHTSDMAFQIGDPVMHHNHVPPRGTSAKFQHP
ncbi:unnamed protein product [Schistocephalus solidus]|uniref:Integrase catalytic domain-containing protein n=1 Tax=Schistocephalus solidus TaxID=70667 RepID=A0A183SJH8_SCHSO|nr:unnamed protein product [Schistocephalus solidus]